MARPFISNNDNALTQQAGFVYGVCRPFLQPFFALITTVEIYLDTYWECILHLSTNNYTNRNSLSKSVVSWSPPVLCKSGWLSGAWLPWAWVGQHCMSRGMPAALHATATMPDSLSPGWWHGEQGRQSRSYGLKKNPSWNSEEKNNVGLNSSEKVCKRQQEGSKRYGSVESEHGGRIVWVSDMDLILA